MFKNYAPLTGATPAPPKPVTQPATPAMVENNDGGFVFALTPLKYLERFLVLGITGNSYYQTKGEITAEAVKLIDAALQESPKESLELVCAISDAGRAASNEQALYVLAKLCAHSDAGIRRAAFAQLPRVIRTGTHFLHFAAHLKGLKRGSGQAAKRGIAALINSYSPEDLTFQMLKYAQRDGWTWKDVIRIFHPKPATPETAAVLQWAVGKAESAPNQMAANWLTTRTLSNEKDVVNAIREYKLPAEAVPDAFKNSPVVWAALIPHTGQENLLRNLANLGEYGVLVPGKWEPIEALAKRFSKPSPRLHPATVYKALKMYSAGERTKNRTNVTWSVVAQVVTALESLFYASFVNVTPTNKTTLEVLDVSHSMLSGNIANIPNSNPREAAALMAMLTLKRETRYIVKGFSARLIDLPLHANMSLAEVMAVIDKHAIPEYTNLGLPLEWLLSSKTRVDVVKIYTDSEVNTGRHAFELVKEYRRRINPALKVVVCAMSLTNFSVAPQDDSNWLDVAGFDAHYPALVNNFIALGE